jgi:hypothetical protein
MRQLLSAFNRQIIPHYAAKALPAFSVFTILPIFKPPSHVSRQDLRGFIFGFPVIIAMSLGKVVGVGL